MDFTPPLAITLTSTALIYQIIFSLAALKPLEKNKKLANLRTFYT